jgi:hypothetical protein
MITILTTHTTHYTVCTSDGIAFAMDKELYNLIANNISIYSWN